MWVLSGILVGTLLLAYGKKIIKGGYKSKFDEDIHFYDERSGLILQKKSKNKTIFYKGIDDVNCSIIAATIPGSSIDKRTKFQWFGDKFAATSYSIGISNKLSNLWHKFRPLINVVNRSDVDSVFTSMQYNMGTIMSYTPVNNIYLISLAAGDNMDLLFEKFIYNWKHYKFDLDTIERNYGKPIGKKDRQLSRKDTFNDILKGVYRVLQNKKLGVVNKTNYIRVYTNMKVEKQDRILYKYNRMTSRDLSQDEMNRRQSYISEYFTQKTDLTLRNQQRIIENIKNNDENVKRENFNKIKQSYNSYINVNITNKDIVMNLNGGSRVIFKYVSRRRYNVIFDYVDHLTEPFFKKDKYFKNGAEHDVDCSFCKNSYHRTDLSDGGEDSLLQYDEGLLISSKVFQYNKQKDRMEDTGFIHKPIAKRNNIFTDTENRTLSYPCVHVGTKETAYCGKKSDDCGPEYPYGKYREMEPEHVSSLLFYLLGCYYSAVVYGKQILGKTFKLGDLDFGDRENMEEYGRYYKYNNTSNVPTMYLNLHCETNSVHHLHIHTWYDSAGDGFMKTVSTNGDDLRAYMNNIWGVVKMDDLQRNPKPKLDFMASCSFTHFIKNILNITKDNEYKKLWDADFDYPLPFKVEDQYNAQPQDMNLIQTFKHEYEQFLLKNQYSTAFLNNLPSVNHTIDTPSGDYVDIPIEQFGSDRKVSFNKPIKNRFTDITNPFNKEVRILFDVDFIINKRLSKYHISIIKELRNNLVICSYEQGHSIDKYININTFSTTDVSAEDKESDMVNNDLLIIKTPRYRQDVPVFLKELIHIANLCNININTDGIPRYKLNNITVPPLDGVGRASDIYNDKLLMIFLQIATHDIPYIGGYYNPYIPFPDNSRTVGMHKEMAIFDTSKYQIEVIKDDFNSCKSDDKPNDIMICTRFFNWTVYNLIHTPNARDNASDVKNMYDSIMDNLYDNKETNIPSSVDIAFDYENSIENIEDEEDEEDEDYYESQGGRTSAVTRPSFNTNTVVTQKPNMNMMANTNDRYSIIRNLFTKIINNIDNYIGKFERKHKYKVNKQLILEYLKTVISTLP